MASSNNLATAKTPDLCALQLWGGVECTCNRVGDQYFDQMLRTGHASRIEDIDDIAQLGIVRLRYPVLWERTAPDTLSAAHWKWADERLRRINEVGMKPIVGLVHHGSGPRSTDLTQRSFADGLAQFAGAVARRYPWVDAYTPVNEPLTTARFSGLYGHWYPHARSERACSHAIVNQCRAVAMSMHAIRTFNPRAQLVQTEDLGYTFSTPTLKYQADFENERRWLTFDLLAGKVNQHHRMWHHLTWAGVAHADLQWFLDYPCPPDIIGVNYYITGERYLDERFERYPPHVHGGNGRHRYADVEAVRVREEGILGPQALLAQTWNRYRRPIAVTEAHIGCTVDEQIRWFAEVWKAAEHLRTQGMDIRAVTAWSLLGAFDWDSLVTCCDGSYEAGAFDVRNSNGHLHRTELGDFLATIQSANNLNHPYLKKTGWWQTSDRLLYKDRSEIIPT